ncbi:MAG: hypothetical protein Q9209_006199 [Squamulea sp. 1 TL-2023]
MNSVPLHCHICPKRPDFSDISHLLTHIGSKGHLAHIHKAQVRSNQDASIRQQLEIYERWYTEHQIEKLLSQRMVLKDSKKANGVARATKRERSASSKLTKLSRATDKKGLSTKKLEIPTRAEAEDVIDPQLSQATAFTSQDTSFQPPPTSSSPGFDLTSIHHAPYPSTRSVYAPSNRSVGTIHLDQQRLATSIETRTVTDGQMVGSDTESVGKPSPRQSMEPLYPEPPQMQVTDASSGLMEITSNSQTVAQGRTRRVQNYQAVHGTEEVVVPRTPELKGVYYPGMSLFDAASAEAQKKRNQRKHDSLLAQIQQESLDVECNEYIYWPDGSLKMCRFITGDVQSSPFKDDTPPAPPPKRRRGRKSKHANKDFDQERHTVTGQSQINRHESAHGSLNNYPEPSTKPAYVHYAMSPVLENDRAFTNTKEEGEDWLLNLGEPALGNRRSFPVFSDRGMPTPSQAGSPVKHQPNPLNPSMGQYSCQSPNAAYRSWLIASHYSNDARSHTNTVPKSILSSFPTHKAGLLSRPILGAMQSLPIVREGNEHSPNLASNENTHDEVKTSGQALPINDAALHARRITDLPQSAHPRYRPGKENLPPLSEGAEQLRSNTKNGRHPTEVQKYFMIQGNQGAQVSTTLPPEMAFGGMKTPPVYKASLNPLNPNAHLRQSLPYSSYYTPFRSGQADTFIGRSNTTLASRQDPADMIPGGDRIRYEPFVA